VTHTKYNISLRNYPGDTDTEQKLSSELEVMNGKQTTFAQNENKQIKY
jgi:hypothetical protein